MIYKKIQTVFTNDKKDHPKSQLYQSLAFTLFLLRSFLKEVTPKKLFVVIQLIIKYYFNYFYRIDICSEIMNVHRTHILFFITTIINIKRAFKKYRYSLTTAVFKFYIVIFVNRIM